jgi:hypothetical protein
MFRLDTYLKRTAELRSPVNRTVSRAIHVFIRQPALVEGSQPGRSDQQPTGDHPFRRLLGAAETKPRMCWIGAKTSRASPRSLTRKRDATTKPVSITGIGRSMYTN